MSRARFPEGPVTLTGVAALWRWLHCKTSHGRLTHMDWTETGEDGLLRRRYGIWCGECGRPLKPSERDL